MDIERTARAQDTPQEMGERRQGKLQLSCCCLVSLHFLWGILHTSRVQGVRNLGRNSQNISVMQAVTSVFLVS